MAAILALVVLVPCPRGAADEAEYRVIVHPDNPTRSASRRFLTDAFLKRATSWDDGETIQAVDQKPDAAVRARFTRSVLKRSVAAVRNYWQQQIFSGRGVPPPELDSDQAVVEYVRKHRGAVGYVSGAAELRGAHTLAIED